MKRLIQLSLVIALAAPAWGTTFFVRTDGGTRYDASLNPTGQCSGTTDAAYPGSGTNQSCGFNDVRLLYNLGTGTNITNWAMAGGDIAVIRVKSGGWRIGGDGTSGPYEFCDNTNYWSCSMPPPPSGTSGAHTRFLGACAYGTYTCNPVSSYPYTSNNLTQLFGGFGAPNTIWLGGAQYVDFVGLEITEHNAAVAAAHTAWASGTTYSQNDSVSFSGAVYDSLVGSNVGHTPGSAPTFWMLSAQCNTHGSPTAPAVNCKGGSSPVDDFAKFGIITNGLSGSSGAGNITLQDVYLHGFTESAIGGPITNTWTLTRVILGFNTFAAWNFDDGSDTPDGTGAALNMSYVTIIGSGALEEYPIVHTSFPALAMWDSVSGGFGDGLSGQDTVLASLTCLHCGLFYNTKDAWIGPHTQVTNTDIEFSTSAGNMGSEWKMAQGLSATTTFRNNLVVENCLRMSAALPGAVQNFNQTTGLPGSYLTNFCRAGGESMSYITRLGSTFNLIGNTMIGATDIMLAFGCGYYSPGNVFNIETDCNSNPTNFTDNNFLGYTDPSIGVASALFYQDPANIYIFPVSTYNNEYGIKSGTGDTCGTNHITCVTPLLTSQPAQIWPGSEAALDVFNAAGGAGNSFYPTSGSPLRGAGTVISGLTADYYGTSRPSPPGLGGVEFVGGPPTAATLNGTINLTGGTLQ